MPNQPACDLSFRYLHNTSVVGCFPHFANLLHCFLPNTLCVPFVYSIYCIGAIRRENCDCSSSPTTPAWSSSPWPTSPSSTSVWTSSPWLMSPSSAMWSSSPAQTSSSPVWTSSPWSSSSFPHPVWSSSSWSFSPSPAPGWTSSYVGMWCISMCTAHYWRMSWCYRPHRCYLLRQRLDHQQHKLKYGY